MSTHRAQPDSPSVSEAPAFPTDVQTPGQVFSGGGELGERIRSFDWSSTPMGPISTWPQSLKTAVRILITSRYSMWMGWGPDLIFFYNDAYARQTLGKKHPSALGKPFREVWAEIWSDLDSRIRTVMDTGEATWDEALLLFLERSGYSEETYHTFSYSPLTGDDGKINGLFCVVMEETERVIGERQLALLRHLAAGLSSKITEEEVCIAIPASLKTNPQDLPFTLVYLFENEETRARLACETGIEPGHPAAPAMIEIDAADAVWPICDLLNTKGPVFVENLTELFGSMPTGSWDRPPKRAILVPITGQGQDRAAGVFITALNPYRQLNAGYSGFIDLVAGQIAAGIANARAYERERHRAEELAALDRAKTTFFSNVSHEFRTPLTLMLGPTEDALANPEKVLRGRELETVHRNELRLLKLVNTLLDFSRLEAGRVTATYQPTDLSAYTMELASIFRSAIEKAGLNYVVECAPLPQPVYIDREMWEKIVLNLISNALKSTFHGSIELELTNKGDHVEFSVHDTGTGIPEHELAHLFERFRRVEHARRRTHEGSGIGLALVHELLAMHGGQITVQSKVGQGTTFTVTLPYGSQHLPRERVRPEAEQIVPGTARKAFVQEALSWLPGHAVDDTESREDLEAADALSAPLLITSSKPRVLLADDNRDMREYVRRLLSSRFEVTTAENGRQALEKANQQLPALVLSDVMMPEMDGLQLLAALRENPATSSVPVVLLSARAGEESLIEGMMSGADDYVVKPFTARELLARVEAHIKIASFRREALERESRLQSELRESEREQQQLLDVVNQSTDFIGLADMQGRVLYVNKSARAMMGLGEAQDVRQLRIKDFFFPEDVPFLEHQVISTVVREGRWQGEVNFRHFKTGASIPVDYHVFPVNDPQTGEMAGLATVTRDMRERKKTEAALRKSEEQYRVLAELSPQALWTADRQGRVLYANQRFLEYVGKDFAPRDGTEYLDLFHEEDRERVLNVWTHSVKTGEDYMLDARLIRANDGAARWWHWRALPLRDDTGAIQQWLGVANDVHESRVAEEAVRTERARLVEMFRQAPAFMAMLRGPEHVFERTNQQYQELIGNRDVLGKPLRQALPEAAEQGFVTILDKVYQTGEPFVASGLSISIERVPGAPLEERYLDFVYQPMRESDDTISGVLVLGVDVTERKRAQSALLQSEKLAAVGRLSASIAHEINNPLEAVTNLLYLINEEKDLPAQARSFTHLAQQELARVSQIATQTLRFYRQPTARTAVRVAEQLDSVLKLYQGRLASAGVEVVRDYRASAPLLAFEGELRQVFTNLVGNALDASRNGGKMTLRTREATDWRTGRKGIRVTVADCGHGMSKETLRRIFEPFFSTKGITGTGLGLWVTLGIIQKHEGRVKVRSSESPEHHGTVFSVFIPH
ncbi:MAG: ATP-binding protein, partial [Candidatus Angelobacter sp.]